MSSDPVGHLHQRLREELDRVGLKLAAASRAAGEPSAQRLKDVVSGRVRCPADLVERLAPTGIDVMYVITGEALDLAGQANGATSHHLPADEQLLLEAYRGLSATARKALLAELLTGGKKARTKSKAAVEGEGIKVSGTGHRVAGRDYHE